MAIDPTIVDLSTRLGSVVANNTIPTIMDRINQAKATKEKDQTIKYLEGIINDLISDKMN
ncbi:hypothetical protein [Piscibacillus salipiscarius]|uniref:hypothetical protein n=1 Tax=Piscibacillus salipiscarius TaxID=299480 RepID=UPI0006D023FA|nr:hypothetical protein [Piscibacillus salipiscarius]